MDIVSAESSDDGARLERVPSSEAVTDRLMTVRDEDVVDALVHELGDEENAVINDVLKEIVEPTRSAGSSDGVDWSWWIGQDDDLDEDNVLADDEDLVVDPLDDEERWRRLLVLYDRADHDGFEGTWWEALATAVVQYAMGILDAWIVSGLIWGKARAIGWPAKPTDRERRLLEADWISRRVLVNEMAFAALQRWQQLEQDKDGQGWDRDGGAALTSWFVTGCLYTFPNEFGKWQTTQRWRRNEGAEADLDVEVSEIAAEAIWKIGTWIDALRCMEVRSFFSKL